MSKCTYHGIKINVIITKRFGITELIVSTLSISHALDHGENLCIATGIHYNVTLNKNF